MKRDFIFVIATLFSLVASAYEIDGIYYRFSGNEAEVTYKMDKWGNQISSYSGAVVIPKSVTYGRETYTVTSIGSSAFSGCNNLTSITIPNSVTSIGSSAFENCNGLTSLIIPESVTSFEQSAFSECTGLTSVTIPKSVKRIGILAFEGCSGLTSVTIENGVTSIAWGAFQECSSLTSVSIPSSVTSIEKSAFLGCTSLTSITIPNSVTEIGEYTFQKCKSLTSVTLSNGLTEIKPYVFSKCSSLASIIIPESVTSIGSNAFWEDICLVSITLGSGITSIGNYAFNGCSKLITVKGLRNDISIGENIFKDCPYNFDDYLVSSFDNYADKYIHTKIEEWQKKGEFETTAQYQTRVTKENQQKKIQELMQEAINGYIKKHPLEVELGNYDADLGIYTLNSNYGKKDVKIPVSVAPTFKSNFKNASFSATYSPTEDGLKIKDLTIKLNGRTYQAEKTTTDIAATAPILEIDLPEVEIPIEHKPQPQQQQPQQPRQQQQQLAQNSAPVTAPVAIDKSIDQNIPSGIMGNDKTFAVIIGNEKYTQVAHVPYAANDAKIFAEYCKKTLGLPEKNVRQYENATFGTILTAVSDIRNIAQAYNGDINVIFYYAGHGIPNESTRDAFLLPVDANGQQTEACYPLSRLYKELGELGAKNVTVFLDACFSGSQRGEGMLASARGVVVVPKIDNLQGNVVVFSAATGSETAYPYEEKGHGLFTYFLLKKLRDTKGDCTLGELGEYIQTNVRQQSVVVNRKSQTPTVVPSQSLMESWKTMKLK